MAIKKNFVRNYWLEIISALFMLAGIIAAFFIFALSALLVGIALGMGFYDEIRIYFLQLKTHFTRLGLYKALMLIGLALFFLLVIPPFLIGCALGYGIFALVRWAKNRK